MLMTSFDQGDMKGRKLRPIQSLFFFVRNFSKSPYGCCLIGFQQIICKYSIEIHHPQMVLAKMNKFAWNTPPPPISNISRYSCHCYCYCYCYCYCHIIIRKNHPLSTLYYPPSNASLSPEFWRQHHGRTVSLSIQAMIHHSRLSLRYKTFYSSMPAFAHPSLLGRC